MRRHRRLAFAAVAAVVLVLAGAAPAAAELRTSRAGVELIVEFEGFPNGGAPYNDPAPGRHCTVGFGHLIHLGPCTLTDFLAVWVRGQASAGRLTRPEAMALLSQRLAQRYEPPVRSLFRRGSALAGKFNQHRFDALVSFVYNLGPGAVTCVSGGFETLCRALRSHDPASVGDALLRYSTAGGVVLPGLVRRRGAERTLFRRPMGRFELFPAREVRWIREWDAGPAPVRRAQLRAAMRALAQRIERAAAADRPDGERVLRRQTRAVALTRRAR